MAYDNLREQFQAAHDRFETAMTTAAQAHFDGVIVVGELMDTVIRREADLTESVEELKRMIGEQGDDLRALRARLDERDGR